MYQIVATDGRAKSAHMETVHGVIETPVFMNVGTSAAIKGAVATDGSEGDRYTGGVIQYLSSSCSSGRCRL